MSYLHCHNCGWSQDDFWEPSPGYNPFRKDLIRDLEESIFKDTIEFDKGFIERHPTIPYTKENGMYYVKGTDYVAMALEQKAKQIRNMDVKTYSEWKKIQRTWKCPRCSQCQADID